MSRVLMQHDDKRHAAVRRHLRKKFFEGFRPPADAPMPTMGKPALDSSWIPWGLFFFVLGARLFDGDEGEDLGLRGFGVAGFWGCGAFGVRDFFQFWGPLFVGRQSFFFWLSSIGHWWMSLSLL